MATYVWDVQRLCYGAPSAAELLCDDLNDKLLPGDTLVVSSVGCLGESYAEIFDALHELMRRRVLAAIMQRAEMKSGVLRVIVVMSAARGARFRHRHWMAAGSDWTKFAG